MTCEHVLCKLPVVSEIPVRYKSLRHSYPKRLESEDNISMYIRESVHTRYFACMKGGNSADMTLDWSIWFLCVVFKHDRVMSTSRTGSQEFIKRCFLSKKGDATAAEFAVDSDIFNFQRSTVLLYLAFSDSYSSI